MLNRDEHELSWFMRCAWHRLAGVEEPTYDKTADYGRGRHRLPDLQELRTSQWCDKFESLMRNRLLMGAFRYGLLPDNCKAGRRFDSMGSLERHLRLYQETGNQEHLVDIANLALVEFQNPTHPHAHFKPLDDGDHHAERIA